MLLCYASVNAYILLHRTVLYCVVLHCIAVHGIVLYCIVLYCTVFLYDRIVYDSILHFFIVLSYASTLHQFWNNETRRHIVYFFDI